MIFKKKLLKEVLKSRKKQITHHIGKTFLSDEHFSYLKKGDSQYQFRISMFFKKQKECIYEHL